MLGPGACTKSGFESVSEHFDSGASARGGGSLLATSLSTPSNYFEPAFGSLYASHIHSPPLLSFPPFLPSPLLGSPFSSGWLARDSRRLSLFSPSSNKPPYPICRY